MFAFFNKGYINGTGIFRPSAIFNFLEEKNNMQVFGEFGKANVRPCARSISSAMLKSERSLPK